MTRSVLYIGPMSGTSLHRKNAFSRLGFEVVVIEPRKLLPSSPWVDRFEWHVSPQVLGTAVERQLRKKLAAGTRFDLAFVDGGSLITAASVRLIKRHAKHVVNFNHDDPFGKRDGPRFSAYRRALAEYDLVTVVREANVDEARAMGARHVLLHPMVSDEVEHLPRPMSALQIDQWRSDVVFVGSWMPERGPFIVDLLEQGIDVSLYGPRWDRAPEWAALKSHHRAEYLEGIHYAYAIQSARISLGLLSKGNRDQHTTRSMEIPALGGLLCAERTDEHTRYYEEGSEALFWADSTECAAVCRAVLNNEPRRLAIVANGQLRHLSNGFTSENLIRRITNEIGETI